MKVDVFVNGEDDYKAYRIPSLISTPKGTLLAFCEGRKFNGLDESPTDLVLKRSFDGGKTWQPLQVIVNAVPEAAMSPTPVIDRSTGAIILVYDLWPEYIKDTWPTADYKRPSGLGRDSATAWSTTSSDDGATPRSNHAERRRAGGCVKLMGAIDTDEQQISCIGDQ